ncbi:MAG TPA: hypothetical protein VF933_01485 [Streptosporangiaceae bacterium]
MFGNQFAVLAPVERGEVGARASADDPYTTDAGGLPANLGAAIDALEADAELTRAMGSRFVPYYAALTRGDRPL